MPEIQLWKTKGFVMDCLGRAFNVAPVRKKSGVRTFNECTVMTDLG